MASFRHSNFVIRHLLDQPNRQRIAIEFPFACLNGGDNDQHQVQEVQYAEDNKPNQHQAENTRDQIVDQH